MIIQPFYSATDPLSHGTCKQVKCCRKQHKRESTHTHTHTYMSVCVHGGLSHSFHLPKSLIKYGSARGFRRIHLTIVPRSRTVPKTTWLEMWASQPHNQHSHWIFFCFFPCVFTDKVCWAPSHINISDVNHCEWVQVSCTRSYHVSQIRNRM